MVALWWRFGHFDRFGPNPGNEITPSVTGFSLGAAHRNRTDNLPITNRVLYRIELERHNKMTVAEHLRGVKPGLCLGCVLMAWDEVEKSRFRGQFRV